jgi:2-polyprenyl-6-methoxyphenol hydroxylase-like FAD-dependent oxidoreductase
VFGPQSQFEAPLGYTVAAFEVSGYKPRDELVSVVYGVPGRAISRLAMREDKTLFLCVFRDEYLKSLGPADTDARKAAVQTIFGRLGWECNEILAAMQDAPDVYFDRVSQIRMPRWTNGRTALVGDAAAAVSLMAGEGAGLAMAEAYVLAGELHASPHDFAAAFARYETRMMPFVKGKQASAARFASSFAPRTQRGIRVRNLVTRFLRIPVVAEFFLTRSVRDDIVLPDYGL